MPQLSKDFKQAIEKIPVQDLKKLVIEMAAKNQEFHDLVNIRYISGKDAEQELYEETREKVLAEIWYITDRGIVQKNLSKAISKAVNHINQYVKISKNKVGEADLLLGLLNEIFQNHSNELGTCWTVFDSKLAVTTNRFYNLITGKLHEDHLIEYKEPMDGFLKILHERSNHLDYVYHMPVCIRQA